jgi:hypothetical protein
VLASIGLAPAGSLAFAQEEENCSVVPTDEDFAGGPGWSIETCSNGEINYISPSGSRCIFNEASSVISCEKSDGTISRINPAD